MPQDLLQIALEHHRAGRLRQAEAAYRAIAENEPDNADAAHWLGVLCFQAARVDEAMPLLRRAVQLRPADPAFQYNLGQACLSCGRLDQAIDALEKAEGLDPKRVDTQIMLGQARLARQSPGDVSAAVGSLRAARDSGVSSPELHDSLGLAFLAAKLPDQAIVSFEVALSLKADSPLFYHHLAMAHRLKGEDREVRKNLIKALELDPSLARAWYDLGMLDAGSGNLALAAGLFRKAIAAKADFTAAWTALVQVLHKLGKTQEAASALHEAIRASDRAASDALSQARAEPPTIAELERKLTSNQVLDMHVTLASLLPIFTPATLPRPSLSDLFDKYAGHFDEMLVNTLQYQVPQQVAEAVAAARKGMAQTPIDILDLGCGTGLCGKLLKPIARNLCGVDLSAGMIEKARERGIYDELHVGELLDEMKRSPRAFDLIVAADVFIYVGDLAEVFESAAACLRPGGLFIFSVEAGIGDRYNLGRKARRYTHSAPYLHRLAAMCGFEEVAFSPVVLRFERGQIVPGYLPTLRWPGAEHG